MNVIEVIDEVGHLVRLTRSMDLGKKLYLS